MEILRNIFGSLTSGVIRLLVTVGIIAAIGFFLVKPALDTTKQISHEVNVNVGKSLEEANFGEIGKTIEDVNRKVQREVRRSFHQANAHGVGNPQKLVKCIQRAHGDVHRIQRCTVKY
jgi:broad specificity phosphatase PhoE